MDIRRSSAGFASAGRSSLLFNEDDYDYALELHPDDEYRYVFFINRIFVSYLCSDKLLRRFLTL